VCSTITGLWCVKYNFFYTLYAIYFVPISHVHQTSRTLLTHVTHIISLSYTHAGVYVPLCSRKWEIYNWGLIATEIILCYWEKSESNKPQECPVKTSIENGIKQNIILWHFPSQTNRCDQYNLNKNLGTLYLSFSYNIIK